MAPLRIEVTGESTLHRPPERATVSLSVHSEGPSQEEVASNVATTSNELRSVLQSLADNTETGQNQAPVTKWSNSSLSTGSFFRYTDTDTDNANGGEDNQSKTRIHTASTTFKATFRDFIRLGAVVTTLSISMPHVSVTGMEWTLTDETRASLGAECRRQAVADALGKGRDYAEALGRHVPEVTEVKDSAGGYGRPVGRVFTQAAAFRPGGGGGRGERQEDFLDFMPEDVEVECSVLVVFEERG